MAPERVYAFALEVCEEVERLGGDSVWLTEHHGCADRHLPQPSHLRRGMHQVHPHRYGHARAAAASGALTSGWARDTSPADFDRFGADWKTRYKATRVRSARCDPRAPWRRVVVD